MPDAVLGRRRDVVPERQVFGQILDFGAIAGLGVPGPRVDCLDVVGVARGSRELEAGSRGNRIAQGLEAVQAQIVPAALHVGGGERHAERLAQDGRSLK